MGANLVNVKEQVISWVWKCHLELPFDETRQNQVGIEPETP